MWRDAECIRSKEPITLKYKCKQLSIMMIVSIFAE